MTRVLHRISRSACPAADRPWIDALFAELETIESGRARLLWLLGAADLILDRYMRQLAALVTPAAMLCLMGAAVFLTLALTQYEGLAPEDDWYFILAAIFTTSLIGVSGLSLRRNALDVQP